MVKKVEQVNNEQGFKIITMPGIACKTLFGRTHCDLCRFSIGIEDSVYYESVIDQYYCKECHNLYIMTAVRYSSEVKQEVINFNQAKRKLEGAKWWNRDLI